MPKSFKILVERDSSHLPLRVAMLSIASDTWSELRAPDHSPSIVEMIIAVYQEKEKEKEKTSEASK